MVTTVFLLFLLCTNQIFALRNYGCAFRNQLVSNQLRIRSASYHITKQAENDHVYLRRLHYQDSTSRLFAESDSLSDNVTNIKNPLLPIYAVLWAGLLVYANFLSPGSSPENASIDASIIQTLISTPFDGTITPYFTAVFNFLGIIPAIYACLLLPGSKNQSVPALPFVVSSFALGFFGIGPYLGLRKLNYTGTPNAVWENKLLPIGMLLFFSYLIFYAITTSASISGGPNGAWAAYMDLFFHQRLVHVSTLDFIILSLAVSLKNSVQYLN